MSANFYYRRFLSIVDRFMAFVQPEPMSGCWLWVGNGADEGGRGSFWLEGKNDAAYRAAWRIFVGPIPDGLQICHKCDIPPCVNPTHLFPGTQLDNKRDAAEKGRNARGETIANSVVTEALVVEIKRAALGGEGPTTIANRLGLKRVTVSAITTGRNWRHVHV